MTYKVWCEEDDAILSNAVSVNNAVWDWLNSEENEHIRDELVGECGNWFDVYVDDGQHTVLYRGHTEMVLHLEAKG